MQIIIYIMQIIISIMLSHSYLPSSLSVLLGVFYLFLSMCFACCHYPLIPVCICGSFAVCRPALCFVYCIFVFCCRLDQVIDIGFAIASTALWFFRTMPGAFMTLIVMPRFLYLDAMGNPIYGTRAFGYMHGLMPVREAGKYCLESTRQQNLYDTIVYSTEVPFVSSSLLADWHREAWRLCDHPMFSQVVAKHGPIEDLYQYGGSQQHVLVRLYGGSPIRTAYVVLDYSGAIDLWFDSEFRLPLGVYGVFRLIGVRQQQDWYLCRRVQFLRLDKNPGESFSRM